MYMVHGDGGLNYDDTPLLPSKSCNDYYSLPMRDVLLLLHTETAGVSQTQFAPISFSLPPTACCYQPSTFPLLQKLRHEAQHPEKALLAPRRQQ